MTEREKRGKRTSRQAPDAIVDREYTYPAFANGNVLPGKKTGRLPAMGWNSWNAFGSGNTQELTKQMADAMVKLELDQAGYQYLVLDDGCYRSERVDDRLMNEEWKFPDGFRALADYIHGKGLKFGMYNDIGTNLCAGAAVGTCGYEDLDAQSYIDWQIDFIKVDNCYYLWDNATFSDACNARFVFAPNIRGIKVYGNGYEQIRQASEDGIFSGQGVFLHRNGYATNIGTVDGTNTGVTPVGERSGELIFHIEVPENGSYDIMVEYATGKEEGVGEWLQLAVGEPACETRYYDSLMPETADPESFAWSQPVAVSLKKGNNIIRLMNHRRQENVLNSYAALFEGLNREKPGHDICFSICEWGKTQPQNWGYKVGDSWRILNDITFQVGSDQNPGRAAWEAEGTASITSQYNKAVVMDEFAGLDRGWNDPDMMVIGMDGITPVMCKTHMTMWCMMNAPLMLGMDLRRLTKGDILWNIIANRAVIALNQDALGIQAKRIWCSIDREHPDTTYITDNDRVDILAKPLADGSAALCFINLSGRRFERETAVCADDIIRYIGHKMADKERFKNAQRYQVEDLWTGDRTENTNGCFSVKGLDAYDSVTYRIMPV